MGHLQHGQACAVKKNSPDELHRLAQNNETDAFSSDNLL